MLAHHWLVGVLHYWAVVVVTVVHIRAVLVRRRRVPNERGVDAGRIESCSLHALLPPGGICSVVFELATNWHNLAAAIPGLGPVL